MTCRYESNEPCHMVELREYVMMQGCDRGWPENRREIDPRRVEVRAVTAALTIERGWRVR